MKHRNRFPKTRTATGLKPTPCKARNPSLAVLKLSSIYRQVRPSIRQIESLRLRKLQTAQDSCQRLAKHKPEKLPNVTFGIQKKQVYNSPTSEETLPGTLVWNRSEIISKLGLAKRVRKPQTAAGSCQRLATHMPEKLPNVIALESIKNKSITLRHRKKHFDYSQRRSSVIATKSSRNLALENGSESLKQQQDSCQRLAKHKPEKLLKRRLRNPLKGKKKDGLQAGKPLLESFRERLELWPWDIACQSLEQQQDSCPRHAKHKPIKLSKRRLRNPLKGKKKDSLQAFRHRKNHFYYSQVRSSGSAPKASRNLALENGSESKSRTAAGFVPKACKTQANKTLETSPIRNPLKRKKRKEKRDSLQAFSPIARNNSTIARYARLEYARLESRRHPLEIWLWKTVPKASNSSRIRGQGMQNTSQ